MTHALSRRLCLALLLSAGLSAPAAAHDFSAGAIGVDAPWAREAPPGAKASAVYFIITNTGTAPDRLLGAASGAAAQAGLHKSETSGQLMSMTTVAAVAIAPGATVAFEPGGLHVMLTGLKTSIAAGTTLPLTLRFEKAGTLTLTVRVLPLGANGPGAPSMGSPTGDQGNMHGM